MPDPISASKDLQEAVALILEADGALPIDGPVIRRREKEIDSDIESGLAITNGIVVFVMPPLPTSALEEVPFVFFDGYEIRVRIIEMPNMNSTGRDTYDLIDAIALALHWQPSSDDSPIAGKLAYPLALAQRPVEMVEGAASAPGFDHDGKLIRIADVIFNAVLQLNQPTP